LNTTATSATALLANLRTGEATASDVVDGALARLNASESRHRAFRTVVEDAARAAAVVADERWKHGEARRLEGVPFAVKDNVDTRDVLTTAGTIRFADRVPVRNATVVQRLLDAGAILIGKTATPELAFGDAIEGHRPVNPWHADHWTGGSSSGSAVALAVGEVPLALGTDTGGSIRVPSSYCGVCGLKPTLGSVPRDGVVPVSATLDQPGPMARTVDDVALMFAVMADRTPSIESSPLRVGLPTGWFFAWGAPDVLDAARQAAVALIDMGVDVEEVDLPRAGAAGRIAWTITVAEFSACYGAGTLDDLTAGSRARIEAGGRLTAVDYLRALDDRALVRQELDEAFTRVDAILTPATPTPAPRIAPTADPLFEGGDEAWLERIARNFLIANVTGAPALVVPVGEVGGLPIAVQVLAPPNREHTCLRVGRLLQSRTPTRSHVPSVGGPVAPRLTDRRPD
jgi:aspartyl-tRNA(Asn)/glutamyl-tRNA(Gln) amidotransferase subunit A